MAIRKPDRAAVVLNEQAVVVKAPELQKAFDHFRDLVECVCILRWIRKVAISKTRIVRSNYVKSVRQSGN